MCQSTCSAILLSCTAVSVLQRLTNIQGRKSPETSKIGLKIIGSWCSWLNSLFFTIKHSCKLIRRPTITSVIARVRYYAAPKRGSRYFPNIKCKTQKTKIETVTSIVMSTRSFISNLPDATIIK